MTRKGKIARLPREIRQRLNERLSEGEKARGLVSWLNKLPEVQAILKARFAGAPIREQNISEWRQGGYVDWRQRRAAIEVAVGLGKGAGQEKQEPSGKPTLNEALALWLMREYAVATRELAESGDAEKQARLREMSAGLMRLRRVERQAAKLKLAWKKFAWEKKREAMRRARRQEEREERYGKLRKPMTPEEFEKYARAQRSFLACPTQKDRWEAYQRWKAGEAKAAAAVAKAAAEAAVSEPGSAAARPAADGTDGTHRTYEAAASEERHLSDQI